MCAMHVYLYIKTTKNLPQLMQICKRWLSLYSGRLSLIWSLHIEQAMEEDNDITMSKAN